MSTFDPTTGEPCPLCGHIVGPRPAHFGFSERVTSAINKRDGWTCMMPRCLLEAAGGTRAIDPAAVYPNPWFSAPDHVVEKSNGGPDTVENGRAAHFRCNIVGDGGAVG